MLSDHSNSTQSKIYLKTRYAWYILNAPSNLYRSYFSGYWLKHRALHLLVTSALANPAITLAKFLDSLDTSAISKTIKSFSKNDIFSDDTVRYLFLYNICGLIKF